MIGLDSNVLLRVFIDDNPQQAAAARRILDGAAAESVFISTIALAETVWTLKSRFKVRRLDIVGILESLLQRPEFVIERRDEVDEAIRLFERSPVDFGDCLIHVRGRRIGLSKTISFDEAAVRSGLFAHPDGHT